MYLHFKKLRFVITIVPFANVYALGNWKLIIEWLETYYYFPEYTLRLKYYAITNLRLWILHLLGGIIIFEIQIIIPMHEVW